MTTTQNNLTTIEIKRYGNRKLYRLDESRYLNLGEVLTLAKSGATVQVTDAKTQADLTSETLIKAAVASGELKAEQVLALLQTVPAAA